MFRNGGISVSALIVCLVVIVSNVSSAPIQGQVPAQKSAGLPSHITRGDVMLLKEKIEALEADLELLEPEIPTEVAIDDEEDDVDVEPIQDQVEDEDDDNGDEEIETPVEVEAPNQPLSSPGEEGSPVVDNEEGAAGPGPDQLVDTPGEEEDEVEQEDGNEGLQEQEEQEEDQEEEGEEEEDEGQWEDGIFPYRDPEVEDTYLRKLIIQALTVLYRKDAERISAKLLEQYDRLSEGDIFPQNIAPAPQDLSPNGNTVDAQNMEPGVFVDRPYTDEEIDRENVIAAVESSKRQELNDAELTLLTDILAMEDQGLTLDELLADLEDKQHGAGERQGRPSMEERDEVLAEADAEGEALFGNYKEDIDEDDVPDNSDDDVKISQQATNENQANVVQEQVIVDGTVENDTEGDVTDEDDAEELLKELMSNLNTSLNSFHENKAQSKHNI